MIRLATGLATIAILWAPALARADDGPIRVPTTAAGFGNLSGAEGGHERSMANYVDRSGDAYGRYVGDLRVDRGEPVYRAPSATPIYVLPPPPPAWRSAGISSYDARPATYVTYTTYAPITAPVYARPCRCLPPR